MELPIHQIETTARLQPRVTTNMFIVDEYAQEMREGRQFPPVEVVFDGKAYWLWDGFHRKKAAEQAGLATLEVNVTEGSVQDAEWLALSANKAHGMQRSNSDKRRAIELAFKHPKSVGLSDNQLASHIGVHHSTIAKYRNEVIENRVNCGFSNSHGFTVRQTSNGQTRIYQQRPPITAKIAPEVRQTIALTDIPEDKREIRQLAKLEPEQQQLAVERVLQGEARNIKDAIRKTRLENQIAAIEAIEIPQGKYHVIVLDPPWPYGRSEDITHRAANPYPDMSINDIAELPIVDLMHNDCIVWLWTTNAFMKEAYFVADCWQLDVKTILTWIKPRMGNGDWLRGKTEHCLMCVKGKPVVNLTNQTTELNGEVRQHSRKPEEFYELVEGLCPGKKVELFARQQRKGWQVFGNETDKF